MIAQALRKDDTPRLTKADPAAPVFDVGIGQLSIRAGTAFDSFHFTEAMPVPLGGLVPGRDYVVVIDGGVPRVRLFDMPATAAIPDDAIGGFHFAPGGNAAGRSGGDNIPAINPLSCWDLNFRPACANPRGMACIDGRFWADIYLLGVDHLQDGTSTFGATIAEGNDLPRDPAGKGFKRFDHAAACAVMAHHDKALMSYDEFRQAAFGVQEKSAVEHRPGTTALDAPRTSRFGLMQATGNMWVWGHDGAPDDPRASIFGGSWLYGADAGSRYALLDYWPGDSSGYLGVRGRSDHLQLG